MVPRWAPPASLAVCLLGVVDAVYLVFEHYTESKTFACSENATVNCVKVTTSSYSRFLGVPVADLGLIFFVVMTLLCLPAAWRRASLNKVRIAAAGLGVLSVFYLVWAELFKIDAICLYCTGVHILTVALFVILVFAAAFTPLPSSGTDVE